MPLTTEISDVRRELFEVQETQIKLAAQARGLQERLRVLQDYASPASDLAQLPRTEAILMVLREGRTAMSVGKIHKALEDEGRAGEAEKTIGATLSHLLRQKQVTRPSRGRYQYVS